MVNVVVNSQSVFDLFIRVGLRCHVFSPDVLPPPPGQLAKEISCVGIQLMGQILANVPLYWNGQLVWRPALGLYL